MVVVHLAASAFVGGPESQMLGLIGALPTEFGSAVLSFSEGGRCRALLDAARLLGAEAVELEHNAPRLQTAVREVSAHLTRLGAKVLCCHGYKPDILGLLAGRRARVPVVSISHGWTAATLKVRLNEVIDRLSLLAMDRVVCVSESQARRVRRAGIAGRRVVVIRNAIDPEAAAPREPSARSELLALFAEAPRLIVGAAGRLSPEKGYGVFVEAAAVIAREVPDAGFVQFGDGPLRDNLARRVEQLGLAGRFVFAGFRTDLARVLPSLDLFVLPSYTEGLPVVVLESFAAGVPVVATAVGGTPEVVSDGENGRLVPAGDPSELARRVIEMLADDSARQEMGRRGRALVLDEFTFARQAEDYRRFFESLLHPERTVETSSRR